MRPESEAAKALWRTTRHTGCTLTLVTASAKRATDFKLRLMVTLALRQLRDLRLQKGGRLGFLAGELQGAVNVQLAPASTTDSSSIKHQGWL